MHWPKLLISANIALMLSACGGISAFSDDDPSLWLVPVNHTDRYAPDITVDGAWAGNVTRQGGGYGATCCLFGNRDWSKPVLVKWQWGTEEDPITKAITTPPTKHEAWVKLPGRPNRVKKPGKERWTDEDYMTDQGFLCVIFREHEKVDFAYSSTRTGCRTK